MPAICTKNNILFVAMMLVVVVVELVVAVVVVVLFSMFRSVFAFVLSLRHTWTTTLQCLVWMCQCINCLRNESPFCFTCFVFFFIFFLLFHHNIDLCSTVMLTRMAFNLILQSNAMPYTFVAHTRMSVPRRISHFFHQFLPINEFEWSVVKIGGEMANVGKTQCKHLYYILLQHQMSPNFANEIATTILPWHVLSVSLTL